MRHLAFCGVLSVILFIFMVHAAALPQKRNYKDIKMEEIDIITLGEEVHKSSNFDIKNTKGGKTKGVGILRFTRDLPATTTVSWKALFMSDDNQLTKQAEGKRATLCDFMVKEKGLADMMLKDSNITSCIIKKGTYELRKCAANMDVLPPKIPENRDSWLIDIIMSAGKRVILYLRLSATIIRN